MRKPTKRYPGSPAYKIFHTLWRVRVVNMYIQTESELELFGTRMSGNRRISEAHLESVRDVSISVSEMIRIRRSGGDVWVRVPSDNILIYDLIQSHLREWNNLLMEVSLDARAACPIDDLKDLNELALGMLERANSNYEREDLDDLITAAKARMSNTEHSVRPKDHVIRFTRPDETFRVSLDNYDDIEDDLSDHSRDTEVVGDPHPLVPRDTYEAYKRKSRMDQGLIDAIESLMTRKRNA